MDARNDVVHVDGLRGSDQGLDSDGNAGSAVLEHPLLLVENNSYNAHVLDLTELFLDEVCALEEMSCSLPSPPHIRIIFIIAMFQ